MVLKNIASFLKSHPLIFVFFSLLQIASMLTAVYLYSDTRANRVVLEKYRGTTSVFEIEYPNGTSFETVAQKIQDIAVQTKYTAHLNKRIRFTNSAFDWKTCRQNMKQRRFQHF